MFLQLVAYKGLTILRRAKKKWKSKIEQKGISNTVTEAVQNSKSESKISNTWITATINHSKDRSNVAWIRTTNQPGQREWHSDPVVKRQDRWVGAGPWRHYWQSLVTVVTRCWALPVRILPLKAATSTLSVTTSRSYKDTSPCRRSFHVAWTTATLCCIPSHRQTHAASTVGAECCCKADHRSQTSRTHHTDMASTSLAAGQTTSWIQDGQLGIPSAIKQST